MRAPRCPHFQVAHIAPVVVVVVASYRWPYTHRASRTIDREAAQLGRTHIILRVSPPQRATRRNTITTSSQAAIVAPRAINRNHLIARMLTRCVSVHLGQ